MAGTSTYGATKAYLDFLAKAIAYENQNAMDVMTYQCGLVATKMIGYQPGRPTTLYNKLFCDTPEDAARRALADLGYEFWTHGTLRHDAYAMFYRTCATSAVTESWFNNLSRQKANHVNSRRAGESKRQE